MYLEFRWEIYDDTCIKIAGNIRRANGWLEGAADFSSLKRRARRFSVQRKIRTKIRDEQMKGNRNFFRGARLSAFFFSHKCNLKFNLWHTTESGFSSRNSDEWHVIHQPDELLTLTARYANHAHLRLLLNARTKNT